MVGGLLYTLRLYLRARRSYRDAGAESRSGGLIIGQIVRAPSVLTVFVLAAAYGQCAGLTLPDQTAVPGQILVASLSFSSQGQALSGVQFDVSADAALSFGVLPGAQIGGSAKVLYTGTLAGGGLRVVIVGMNQGTLTDGELLRPLIAVDPNATPGTAQIRIGNVAGVDPAGNAVTLGPVSAAVQIQAGSFTQAFAAGGIVNAASLLAGPISPGEIVTIFGRGDLSGTSEVDFNGTPAPLLYAGPGQVNAIVPLGLDPTKQPASLDIRAQGQSLGTASLPAAAVSPALFTQGSNGAGPGAILNQDYTPNSPSNPASAGSIVMLYGTGFGPLNPPAIDGQPATGKAQTAMPVRASVGGIAADVLYAGAAPGLIAGVVQINVRIPGNLAPNPAAAVIVTAGSVTAPAGVTVSTQ